MKYTRNYAKDDYMVLDSVLSDRYTNRGYKTDQEVVTAQQLLDVFKMIGINGIKENLGELKVGDLYYNKKDNENPLCYIWRPIEDKDDEATIVNKRSIAVKDLMFPRVMKQDNVLLKYGYTAPVYMSNRYTTDVLEDNANLGPLPGTSDPKDNTISGETSEHTIHKKFEWAVAKFKKDHPGLFDSDGNFRYELSGPITAEIYRAAVINDMIISSKVHDTSSSDVPTVASPSWQKKPKTDTSDVTYANFINLAMILRNYTGKMKDFIAADTSKTTTRYDYLKTLFNGFPDTISSDTKISTKYVTVSEVIDNKYLRTIDYIRAVMKGSCPLYIDETVQCTYDVIKDKTNILTGKQISSTNENDKNFIRSNIYIKRPRNMMRNFITVKFLLIKKLNYDTTGYDGATQNYVNEMDMSKYMQEITCILKRNDDYTFSVLSIYGALTLNGVTFTDLKKLIKVTNLVKDTYTELKISCRLDKMIDNPHANKLLCGDFTSDNTNIYPIYVGEKW